MAGDKLSDRLNKYELRKFTEDLASYHFKEMGHDGYQRCQCQMAGILREMSKRAERKYTPVKKRASVRDEADAGQDMR